jgi:hypothetical protein
MLGFASAVSVANASKGVARVPLDQLTETYIQTKIDSVCTNATPTI